jgi:hypothetical protein
MIREHFCQCNYVRGLQGRGLVYPERSEGRRLQRGVNEGIVKPAKNGSLSNA